MPSDEPKPQPTWRDYESLVSHLTSVVRSNTHTLRLVHANGVTAAKLLAEGISLSSALRDSSGANADRVAGKLDILIDLARDTRSSSRDAVSESRATNDRLGVLREDVGKLRGDLSGPHPTMSREELEGPEAGLNERDLKTLGKLWRAVKQHGPTVGWLSGAATAAWHTFRHFLGH